MPVPTQWNPQGLADSIRRCHSKAEADALTEYLIDCHAGVYTPQEIRTEMAWVIATYFDGSTAMQLFERFNLVHPYSGKTEPLTAEEAYQLGMKVGNALKANPEQRCSIHAKQPPMRKKVVRNLIRTPNAEPTTDSTANRPRQPIRTSPVQ
jgi:hypothetical protein